MDSADTPPSSLPPAGLHDLAMELSMLSERRRDWRGLADILGFKYRQICVMEQQRSFEDPTWQARTVLQRWEEASQRRATATVRVLVYALTAVGLRSCLDILQEYLSGVDVDAISKETWRRYKDEDDLRRALFPPLADAEVFPWPHKESRSPRVAMSPGEVTSSSCSPALSPLRPLQPVEQFTAAATQREYHGPAARPDLRTTASYDLHSTASHAHTPVPSGVERVAMPTYLPRSVFISYHPTETSDRQILIADLAAQLRAQEFTVFYDKYCEADIQQQGGLDCWKEWAITHCKNIVVVCTPKYARDDTNYTSPRRFRLGSHPKIAVDSKLLRTVSYSNVREDSSRLIPVFLGSDAPTTCTPTWLRAYRSYRWPDTENDDFIHCIEEVPKLVLPPVREKKVVRPRKIYYKDAVDWDPYDVPRHRQKSSR